MHSSSKTKKQINAPWHQIDTDRFVGIELKCITPLTGRADTTETTIAVALLRRRIQNIATAFVVRVIANDTSSTDGLGTEILTKSRFPGEI